MAPYSAEAKRISVPDPQLERRDVELAIQHWKQNTWGEDCVPFLDTFDFSAVKTGWGQRFLICGDRTAESAVFVAYGAGFARMLGLPAKPEKTIPFMQQLPEAYGEMFAEGYSKAAMESSPVTLEGTIRLGGTGQLFRAVFMPIMLQPSWSKRLVYGSFNYRSVRAV